MIKCRCGNYDTDLMYIKEVKPHIGVYCLCCHKWIKWLSKYDGIKLQHVEDIDDPETYWEVIYND